MAGRTPLVLLACGSFNPITHQHMRLFELARDHMHQTGKYRVVGGIVSPVSDCYGKQGLVASKHRVSMARLALQSSDWVRVDDWESKQSDWTETILTLRYHYPRVASQLQQPESHSAEQPHSSVPQLKLLCGADFMDTFKVPGLWKDEDIEELLGCFGLVCVSRGSLLPDRVIHESDLLYKHRQNIFLVREWIQNEISATEIRRALRRGHSVKYLVPDSVIQYIKQHNLYTQDSEMKNRDVLLRPLSK